MEEEREPRIGVTWIQVAGSALAAVSSAVLLSALGVAGTVIGAAVGSVVATVGTALYTRTLDASRQQVAAQTAALRRVTHAREDLDDAVATVARGGTPSGAGMARASQELDRAEEALAAAVPAGEPDRPTPVPPAPQSAGRALLGGLSWRRVAVLTAGVFVAAMVAITAFELTTGRAVSVYTGGSDPGTGSTVPGLGRTGRDTPGPVDGTPAGGEPDGSGEDEGSSSDADPTDDPGSTTSPAPGSTSSPTGTPTPSAPAEPSEDPEPNPSPDIPVTPSSAPSSTASGATGG